MRQADEIWNRACDLDFKPHLSGDKALHDVIFFHGEIMNGGLDFAIDEDGYEAAADAAAGYRVLGAPDLAKTLDESRAVVARIADAAGEVDIADLTDVEEEKLAALDERYSRLLPDDDSSLAKIFESYLAAHPEAFEPT